jgi:hypothetical protein
VVPSISTVVLDTTTILNTETLAGTETDLKVTATVTDDTGVTSVHAFLFDPLLGTGGNETVLTLISGTDLDGTYQGTMFIPLDVNNGDYQVIVLAANAATVPDDYSTYGINDDRILHILRDEPEPPGPVEPGETDTKDTGYCKVTININAGPVNIYVCDPEKKTEIPP